MGVRVRAAQYGALEAGSLAVGFLLQALLMRALGPSAYGTYALAGALGVLALTVTDFGFNVAGVRMQVTLGETEGHSGSAARRLFWSVQLVKAMVALLVMALGWGWSKVQGGDDAVGWALGMGAAAAWAYPSWRLMALDRAVPMGLSLLLMRVTALLAASFWPPGPPGVHWAVALTFGPQLVAGLALWALDPGLRPVRRPCKPDQQSILKAGRAGLGALWLGLQPLVSAAVLQAVLLQAGGALVLGWYAAADRVRAGLQGLFTAFGAAVFPQLLGRSPSNTPLNGQGLVRMQVGLAFIAAASLSLAAPWVMARVSGTGYTPSVSVLQILAWSLLTSTALGALGMQRLVPAGAQRLLGQALAGLLLAQCVGIALAVPLAGATGAAMVLVASEALAALLRWACLRRPVLARTDGRPGP